MGARVFQPRNEEKNLLWKNEPENRVDNSKILLADRFGRCRYDVLALRL